MAASVKRLPKLAVQQGAVGGLSICSTAILDDRLLSMAIYRNVFRVDRWL